MNSRDAAYEESFQALLEATAAEAAAKEKEALATAPGGVDAELNGHDEQEVDDVAVNSRRKRKRSDDDGCVPLVVGSCFDTEGVVQGVDQAGAIRVYLIRSHRSSEREDGARTHANFAQRHEAPGVDEQDCPQQARRGSQVAGAGPRLGRRRGRSVLSGEV